MRFVVFVGVLYVCLSSVEQGLTESRKSKKNNVVEESEKHSGGFSSGYIKNIQLDEKCKGKQCYVEKPLKRFRYKTDRSNEDEHIINEKAIKIHKNKVSDEEKQIKKYKIRLDTFESENNIGQETKRKNNKRTETDTNIDEHKDIIKNSFTRVKQDRGKYDDKTLKLFNEKRKKKRFSDDNEQEVDVETKTAKSFGKTKPVNSHSNEDLEITKALKSEVKVRRPTRNQFPDKESTYNSDNIDENEHNGSEDSEENLESSENGSNNTNEDEDDDIGSNETNSEFHHSNQVDEAKENDSNSQPSCSKDSDCDEDSAEIPTNEIAPKKQVKYSIKFAHEKKKYIPTKKDNMLKKIHGFEKKKKMFNKDESDEDSSEEDVHPKRLRFIEEEEDY